ncbi:retrovirus-related pol polyprotein from transposon TNT 1-94 [Tanacetum coccineum]
MQTLITRVAKILDEVHLEVCNYWETDLLVGHKKGRKALRYPVRKLNILPCLAVHIDIRFHFIKEQVENGVVELYFVNTEYQLADIFTKALCRERIEFLINKLEMRCLLLRHSNSWQMKLKNSGGTYSDIMIKQYFQIQDYALWEVIENGNSWVLVPHTSQENGIIVTKMFTPAIVEEKTNKKNNVKARDSEVMQLTRNQKTTLKQQYENFSATSVESLDSIFNRLQKIVIVWMNKPKVETMSIDDLYNNFKIVEQKVKKTVGTIFSGQNLAFVTAPSSSSTNDANTACPQDLDAIHEDDLEAIDLKWQLSLLSVRAKKYYQRTGKKIFINANNIAGYDCQKLGHFARECRAPRSKECQFRNQDNTRKQGNNEDTSSKAMLAIDGVGFDWSDMAEEQCDDLLVKLNESEFKAATYKRGLATVEAQLITYRKNELEKVKQEKDGIDFKIEKFDKASKDLDQLLGSQITDKCKKGLGYSAVPPPHPLIYNRPNKLDLSYSSLDEFKETEFKGYGPENSDQESNVVCDKKKSDNSNENSEESLVAEQVSQDTSSFVESSPMVDKETVFPVNKKINCDNHQRRGIVSRNNYNRVDTKTAHPSVHRNMSPKAVLLKTGLTPLNTIRHVNTAHPKTVVHSAKSKTHFSKQAQSTAKRLFYKKTGLTNRYFHQKVNTIRHKVVNTARPYTTPVNTVRVKRVNVVKSSAYWVWRPTKPNGASLAFKRHNYIDARGRSKHMTENIAYLLDFKEFDGGYVAFGGGAYGGRITGKETLKTDNLNFEDVYFVNELKFNLFSVSQMCDKKNYVLFTDTECLVLSPNFKLPDENQILLKIPRKDNMYSFDMKNIVPKESLTCLVANAILDESMLWHRRLGHINFKNINKLVKDNLVRGLPLKRFENDQTCVACLKGKQHRASCKSKVLNPITKSLFMLHMDLFGPTFVSSLMHKKYCLVVTNDYSRFTWVFFLTTKDETSEILKNFIKEIENLVDKKVKIIRSDNGTEFKNKVMDDFCREKGIKREYSVARTPQQNGIAERRNRTLIEAARTMLADSKLPTTFWAKAVSTACYVHNRVLVVKPHNKTPYELFRGFKPALSFMRPFGCHVTILNTLDSLGKFDGKSDEGTISNDYVGTSEEISQDCIVMPIWKDTSYFDSPTKDVDNDDSSTKYVNAAGQHVNTASSDVNIGSLKLNIVGPSVNTASSNEHDSPEDMFTMGVSSILEATHIESFSDEDEPEVDLGNITNSYTVPTTPNTRIHKDLPIDNVIGDVKSSVQTRKMTKPTSEQGFLSNVYEQKTHDTLNTCLYACFLSQIEPTSIAKALSDSSWVEAMQEELLQFKLQQGHKQEEGIDYEEVFAPVARIKAIRLFLAYASFMGFLVYQMDVKSVFLYGTIEEEVNVTQPPGFKDPDHPDKVYKVIKALYGLHQAPRAWYETLANYLLSNGFKRGKIDQTLFIKKQKRDILLVQKEDGIFISQDKYVAEILKKFNYSDVKSASTPVDLEKPLVKDGDADDVDVHLYRSMIRSLMYLTASRPDIMFAVCACARFQVTLKTSHLLAVKRIFRYLKGKPTLGLWYSRDSPFELVAYTNSDYAGATQDRKSTTRGCQFLGNRLISWQCKKQTVVATSTTEAEYVAAASCCGQVLWIQNQLMDYGYNFMNTIINIDNNNLLTKGFDAGRFQYLYLQVKLIEYLMMSALPLKKCLREGS